MAQSRQQKLARQRERQRAYRAEIKAGRKPSRDDIARTLLHWAITQNLKHDRDAELFRLHDAVVDELVAQGFDKRASDAVFDDLIDKYRGGWTFLRKQYLQPVDDGSGGND